MGLDVTGNEFWRKSSTDILKDLLTLVVYSAKDKEIKISKQLMIDIDPAYGLVLHDDGDFITLKVEKTF